MGGKIPVDDPGKRSDSSLLLKTAEDPHDYFLRLVSLEAIGNWKVEEAVPVLLKRLDDTFDQNRITALWALGGIGDRSVVDPVLLRLSDKAPEVRGQAVTTLRPVGRCASAAAARSSAGEGTGQPRSGSARAGPRAPPTLTRPPALRPSRGYREERDEHREPDQRVEQPVAPLKEDHALEVEAGAKRPHRPDELNRIEHER